MKKQYAKKKGQELAEWGIIVALISVVVMGALFALEPNLKQIWNTVNNAFNTVNTP